MTSEVLRELTYLATTWLYYIYLLNDFSFFSKRKNVWGSLWESLELYDCIPSSLSSAYIKWGPQELVPQTQSLEEMIEQQCSWNTRQKSVQKGITDCISRQHEGENIIFHPGIVGFNLEDPTIIPVPSSLSTEQRGSRLLSRTFKGEVRMRYFEDDEKLHPT